jgi:hypothetical protein
MGRSDHCYYCLTGDIVPSNFANTGPNWFPTIARVALSFHETNRESVHLLFGQLVPRANFERHSRKAEALSTEISSSQGQFTSYARPRKGIRMSLGSLVGPGFGAMSLRHDKSQGLMCAQVVPATRAVVQGNPCMSAMWPRKAKTCS